MPPDDNVILTLGNPIYRFKGLDVALQALEKVWNQGHRFSLKWICHQKPQFRQTSTFPLELIVNPSQQELPTLYKQANLFLFTSWYEGFGIPPLEAMASGLPVVLTRCGGVETFATTDNAIMVDPGDVDGLADGVIQLLTDAELRQTYGRREGRQRNVFLAIKWGKSGNG
jgi:glycosyltransferase involved in cell wall biosynthesis